MGVGVLYGFYYDPGMVFTSPVGSNNDRQTVTKAPVMLLTFF